MHPFYDSIIVLYLIASATLAIAILRDRERPGSFEARHRRLTAVVSVFLFGTFAAVFWGSFIEPRIITVHRVSIDLPNFTPTQPARVALISDVHVGTYKKDGWVRRVSRRIAYENPDLVFVAGDMIVNKPEDARYLLAFASLAAKIPTYAVLGDHDHGFTETPTIQTDEALAASVGGALEGAGIQVLSNEAESLALYGAQIWLVGLDDWHSQKTDIKKALAYTDGKGPLIALVHNPDVILDPASKNFDLILAGHTHGGQIRLPFIGPVPVLPTSIPRSFDKGLFTLGNETRLFITSGISESGPRARFFNPPEIVLLELH